MTDNELLLAMSNVMDDKLKPVNDKLEKVEQKQEEMSGRLERVEQKQEEMSGRLERVEQKQEEMSDRMDREFKRVDERLDKVDERFECVNERLDKEFKVVNDRLKKMEITHENEILPRLQTIEECYVSTAKRYQEEADQIQNMRTNISVIETIVAEHSDQIQKLQAVNS